MIIKFDVESDLYGQIENLVKEGKYQDAIQFIKIAITNQLQEEKSDSGIGEQLRGLSEITEEINSLHKNSSKELEKLIENLDSMKFENSEIGKEYEDFIWSFYNRLFPIKIAMYKLAEMSIEKTWVDLEEWKEIAVTEAQKWDKTLSEYELEKELKLNEKITRGLPTHPSEILQLKKKSEKIKMQKKIESSKNRFTSQFMGRYNKKTNLFEGACFKMGLISVKLVGGNCHVSLSELGKRFALEENPIITYSDYTHVFSDKEIKLIYTEIFPQFKGEMQIIKEVINKLKNGKMKADDIHEVFKKHEKEIAEYYEYVPEKLDSKKRKEKIVQARVATMGRLSELKIVDWEIISSVSHYSLNKEKMSLLGI